MENVKALQTIDNYTLLERFNDAGEFKEYIVALNYNPDTKQWDSGDYFTLASVTEINKTMYYAKALDFLLYRAGYVRAYKGELEDKLRRQTINYDRLVELATLFKDGLMQDGEEDARQYFLNDCDMSNEELKFFGVQKRYKVYECEVQQVVSRKIKVAVPEDEGEYEANDEALKVFSGLSLEFDNEIEFGNCDVERSNYIGTYDYEDVDAENDID